MGLTATAKFKLGGMRQSRQVNSIEITKLSVNAWHATVTFEDGGILGIESDRESVIESIRGHMLIADGLQPYHNDKCGIMLKRN